MYIPPLRRRERVKKALTFIIVASRVRRMFFLKLGPLTVLAVI